MQSRGFTLVEMVIVMVLISFIGVYSFSDLPGYEMELNSQAQELAKDIRYTQSLAMTHGQHYKMVFTATTYTFETSGGVAVSNPGTGLSTVTLGTGFTVAYPGLPNSFVQFDGKGIPYTDNAGTALAANAVITITAPDGTTLTNTIIPQTGAVTIP